MTNRPRHPKPDGNQSTIVSELRANGFDVDDVSSLGGTVLDLIVLGYHVLLSRPVMSKWEIKPRDGKLTRLERDYLSVIAEKFGPDVPVRLGRSTEDVLRWYGWI